MCFLEGDHRYHDFVIYCSESGGFCDCGNRDAWKEDGFCKIHQVSNQKPGHLPAKLYEPTKMTVCWALEELSISARIIWVRRLKDQKAAVENEMCVASLFIDWLKKVCSVDVLRSLLSVLVTRKFLDGSLLGKNVRGAKAPLEILLQTLGSMPEELTEGATTLFVEMLYSGWFKSQFTEELMKHYPLMVDDVAGKVIKHSQHEGVITECKALNSTLDRVMVRLFNVAPTVMELIKNNNLLEKFTSVFHRVLKMSLDQRGIVSVEHEAIRHKVYLRPQGDLYLIVPHSPVAANVLNERLDVFEDILKVVTNLQWMNPYTRNRSLDFEDGAWTLPINLEMKTMAVVFQLIACCYSSVENAENPETVKQALVEAGNRTLKSLHSYLSKGTQKLTVKSLMSLHIPLHRVLGAILSKLILLSWSDDKDGFLSSLQVDYTEAEVLSLLELPLRIAAWMAQVRANQWQQVSEEFYRLDLIYRGSFWHDQSWDMDLLLLQFCAVAKEKMEHAIVLRMAECFDLQDLVTSASTGDKMFRFSPSYIQDFLCIILLVVHDRHNTGMNKEESLQYNVIQWLCVRDQTYSELCRTLRASSDIDHEKLRGILAKVANFRQPKVQERGYFQLKPEWWTKFDPLFALFYHNELEDAQERAGHVGKQQFYWRIGPPHQAPPPYNRLTNLLHTQECHQLLWNVLNHVKFLVKDKKTSTAGKALGVTALQMMEIALWDRQQYQPSSAAPPPSGLHPNDILVNIQLSPYTHPRTVEAGSTTWELRSPSMYDLLQELQSLTNAHCLADYAQYTLHLLHSSFQTYFGAGLRPSKSNKSLEYQETTQETPEGDFKNLADSELTDIPDPAGLCDFSELSHSSVNLSSTSVTHQEEDCALRMELAGQPVPGQPHCIAAADNEVLSSAHQERQKDFEDQHIDLGNDNENDDTVPPKGLPKGRGAEGSSKMSTGNALLLLDPKQKIMTLESTCKTQKCYVGNLAGTGSPDIAESAASYFGTFSDSADWLSSMFIINQEEHCDLPMQMVGQFEQPVLDQLHCIAAAYKGQPSSSHQGRCIATQPACIQSPFGQGSDILNPTTIMSGQPCLAPYDKGKQQEELRQSYDSIVWSPVPQQDIPGFVNLPDSAELSEIPGSLNYLEGDSVQPIQLHEPKCSEIDRMHVYNLKTNCNGYIVGEKTFWQSQLKSYMYKFLDFGILEIKKQPRANLDKIYAQMNEEFTYSPYLLNKDVMYNYIRGRLRDLRSNWKKKWEERRDRPSECSPAAWQTLIEHWSTEKVMAEAEKMKKARGAVKNPSHVGRGGRK